MRHSQIEISLVMVGSQTRDILPQVLRTIYPILQAGYVPWTWTGIYQVKVNRTLCHILRINFVHWQNLTDESLILYSLEKSLAEKAYGVSLSTGESIRIIPTFTFRLLKKATRTLGRLISHYSKDK